MKRSIARRMASSSASTFSNCVSALADLRCARFGHGRRLTDLFNVTLADLFPDGRLVVCLVHRLEQLVLVALRDVGLLFKLADLGRRVDLALDRQLIAFRSLFSGPART